jgi:hypothetical protein
MVGYLMHTTFIIVNYYREKHFVLIAFTSTVEMV